MVECPLLTRKEFHGGEKGFLHLFGRTVHMQIYVSREKSACLKKNRKHPLANVCFWSRGFWVNCQPSEHTPVSFPTTIQSESCSAHFSNHRILPLYFLGIQFHYWKFIFSWWGNEWISEWKVTWVFKLWLSLVPEAEPGSTFGGGRSGSYLYAEGWVKPASWPVTSCSPPTGGALPVPVSDVLTCSWVPLPSLSLTSISVFSVQVQHAAQAVCRDVFGTRRSLAQSPGRWWKSRIRKRKSNQIFWRKVQIFS